MPTLTSIPAHANEVVRCLITVGVPSGRWYSRHGSERIGEVEGDLAITDDLILSRVWHASDTVFRLNRSGSGGLASWVWGSGNVRANSEFRPGDSTNSPLGPGHDKGLYFQFGDDDDDLTEVKLLFVDLVSSAGNGWYNVALTAEQNAKFDLLTEGALVNFVIGDQTAPEPAETHDTSGEVLAGAPVVTGRAVKVPAAVKESAGSVSAGAPVVSGSAVVVPADAATVHDTAGSVAAGSPVVSGRAEVVEAGTEDAGGSAESGAPIVSADAQVIPVGAPSDVSGDVSAGAPVVSGDAELVGPGRTVEVETVIFGAALWMPRSNPTRAVMPIVVTIQGECEDVVPALARELSRRIEWLHLGTTCIAADAAPQGTLSKAEGEHVAGGLTISTSPNQSEPEYEGGSPEPSVSECRLELTQGTTNAHADLPLFIDRRRELRRVLSRLNGAVGA